jgi:predicted TPR repeat methyltransferase
MSLQDELLQQARRDVAGKHRLVIHQDSAWKWAALAVAAYERGLRADAVDYYHEAVEHAALADPSGVLLLTVRAWVHSHVPPGML